VRRHTETLANLDRRIGEAKAELARLEHGQAAYSQWCREHAVEVTQGQAAAQVLQERERELLEVLAAYPPNYLLVELGRPPTNPEGRENWLRGAQAVERFRAAHGITDLDEAFARPPWARDEAWRRDHARTQALLRDAREAITDSLAQDLERELSALDQDPPGWPIGA
jgi:hypothetical protein